MRTGLLEMGQMPQMNPSRSTTFAVLALISALLPAPVAAQWTNSRSVDEMTGAASAYAHSPQVSATQPMAFPYQDTRAWLGFGCDGRNEWAYIGFSDAPNLLNTTLREGHSRIETRIRWGDEPVENVRFTQQWGSSFLNFAITHVHPAIEKMESSSTVLVELEWYGSGRTLFRFPLAGSSAAMQQARSQCAR